MSAIEILMLILVLVASAHLLYRINPLYKAVTGDVGPRTRRRLISRGFVAVGLWQWSIAGLMIATGSWATTVALIAAGGFMLAAARLAQARLWPGL